MMSLLAVLYLAVAALAAWVLRRTGLWIAVPFIATAGALWIALRPPRPSMRAPFQYVVLHRSDRPGVYAVQAAHAASEAIRVAPVAKDTRVCVLVAESSDELEQLARTLTAAGIHHSIVREDKPPFVGVATALATEPQPKENVERFFAHLKTLR